MTEKFKIVLSHMFSKKAMLYRLIAFLWTILGAYVFTGELFKSLEVAIWVVVGKTILYGIFEYFYTNDTI